jgi:hypothetical protein
VIPVLQVDVELPAVFDPLNGRDFGYVLTFDLSAHSDEEAQQVNESPQLVVKRFASFAYCDLHAHAPFLPNLKRQAGS